MMAADRGGPVGPYLPLILEACQEGQLASEYRRGNESYGAFTFAMARTLRTNKAINFTQLVEYATTKLRNLGYDQSPQILGPTKVVSATVPWLGNASKPPVARIAKKKAVKKSKRKTAKRKSTKKGQ